MNIPASGQPPTAAEQSVILAAQASQGRCVCGEVHEAGITPAVIARMKGYIAAHPGQQFAADEEAGIMAVIVTPDPAEPGPPHIIAWSRDLLALLDDIGAPPAADLS